ncbi:MAG: hypothetical protein HY706_20680 [Candidatus Hydrogenedentes bacterium]|nr:hypothetical protein [Candidatus Hydrogenedentota bacterium]
MDVLIFSGPNDPQALRVRDELQLRGASVMLVNTSAFPETTRLSFRDRVLVYQGQPLPVPHSVYLRSLSCHPLTPTFQSELPKRPRGLIAQCDEKRAMLESLLLTLERRGARTVNRLEANAQHSQKPYQLELLRAAGLPVPRWLATNDPDAVRAFASDVGALVYKPLAGGATVRAVNAADLSPRRLRLLSSAPVLFQERVEGMSVRAYVVGQRVVAAAEIHSRELDYRRGEDTVVPTRLSAKLQEAVLTAAQACQMEFAGVDLIRFRAGFKLLECNPSPMFATFEKKTTTNIAGPLADYLLRSRRVGVPANDQPETGNWKLETGNWKPETTDQGPETKTP